MVEIIPESIELIKMNDEEYFSERYKQYISNSRLGMLEESIDKFLNGFKEEYSDSFALGSAVHSMVLQPEYFFVSKYDKPTGKLGEFTQKVLSLRSKGYKIIDALNQASIEADYYSGKLSQTRIKTAIKNSIQYYLNRIRLKEEVENKSPLFLSAPMKEKLNLCLAEIYANKNFLNKIKPTGLFENPTYFNEYAIFCEVDVTVNDEKKRIKLKGKLDNFVIDAENQKIILNDLKTTGRPAKFFMGNFVKQIDEDGNEIEVWFDGSYQKYKYNRQMAMYSWLLIAALKQYYDISYPLEANMLVVETIPNYKSAIYKVGNKSIQKGLKELRELLIKVAENDLHTKI